MKKGHVLYEKACSVTMTNGWRSCSLLKEYWYLFFKSCAAGLHKTNLLCLKPILIGTHQLLARFYILRSRPAKWFTKLWCKQLNCTLLKKRSMILRGAPVDPEHAFGFVRKMRSTFSLGINKWKLSANRLCASKLTLRRLKNALSKSMLKLLAACADR